MSNNATIGNETASEHSVSQTVDTLQVVVNIAYMITGGSSATSNFIIIILVLTCKNLRRKELFILLGLALGDVIYGTGFFIGGARRLYLVLRNIHTVKVSPWTCQSEPATFFYVYGPQLSSMMNLVISIDRLMSVTFVNAYQSLSFRYVFYVTGGVAIIALVSYFTGFILSATMPSTPTVLALCLSTQASHPVYGVFYTCLIAVCNCTSIIVYCFVVAILKFRAKNSSGAIHDIQQKRQLKVTKMVGMTTCVDFLLDVIPWAVQMSVNAAHLPDSVSKIVAPVTWVFIQCKRTITVIVYMCKLRELRRSFMDLLLCKLKSSVPVGVIHVNVSSMTATATRNTISKHGNTSM